MGEPVWEIAERFPRQGDWTETDFFGLPEGYPRVELADGRLDVLPMPTDNHQAILGFVYLLLAGYARTHGGWARPAGLRVRLGEGRIREPDVCYLSAESAEHKHDQLWTLADLLVEVVSEGSKNETRDYVEKRREYAQAGVREYWIVDPNAELITVLALGDHDQYREHGAFRRGDTVTSELLAGLTASADAILDAD
jgi:Uma2 family endonuclease